MDTQGTLAKFWKIDDLMNWFHRVNGTDFRDHTKELVLLLTADQLPASPGNLNRATTSRFPDSLASCRNGVPLLSLPWRSAGKRCKNLPTHRVSPGV